MFLLDSDIVIWILRSNPTVVQAVSRVVSEKGVCISSATVAEVYKNWRQNELLKYRQFFKLHPQIPIDSFIAETAGRYWKQYRGINQNTVDYFIAATCKINKLTLLTMNTKHFPMKDIKVINPLAKSNYDH